jgi:hypothetical protein
MLDTRTYDIEFPDGHIDEYTANIIAKNMYAQCDNEGNQFNFPEIIVDHKSDCRAVECADMYIKHTVEVDEYVVSKNLKYVPAFLWWVPHVPKKHNHIIADMISDVKVAGDHTTDMPHAMTYASVVS